MLWPIDLWKSFKIPDQASALVSGSLSIGQFPLNYAGRLTGHMALGTRRGSDMVVKAGRRRVQQQGALEGGRAQTNSSSIKA